MNVNNWQAIIKKNVSVALEEDIGSGDITANLIPLEQVARANLITRESAVICGRPWFDAVFDLLDPTIKIQWDVEDGQTVKPNQKIATIVGCVRHILTGERVAMNFLQTLSATATQSAKFCQLVNHTNVKLLDTRKTIPGLRFAQKYAVTQGGGVNHRIGLFDAFLIKENHIAASGSIAVAVHKAKTLGVDKLIEVEVEDLDEFMQARSAKADRIMLDNFTNDQLKEAVSMNQTLSGFKPELEASGNMTVKTIADVANTGVDYISVGALTKDCKAIDLSLRIQSALEK